MALQKSFFIILACFGFYTSAQKTYTCDFENGLCSFLRNDPNNIENWKIGGGKTNSTDTGPSVDLGKGSYIYVDMTSPNLQEGQTATVVSEILEGTHTIVHCVTFTYYLNGADKSTLALGKMTLDNRQKVQYRTLHFATSDSTDKGWTTRQVRVPTGERFQLYFSATKGSGTKSIIALHDISVVDRTCERPTTEPPTISTEMPPQKTYFCDFENGICSFLRNDPSNRANWKIGRGKTNSADTGPSVDHTLGNANGNYLYVNATAATTNYVKLQTVVLNDNYCVRFFYHMYGADIGHLYVRSQYNIYVITDYFFRSSTQGDRWKEAFFSIVETQSYRVIFRAQHRSSLRFRGDIALDDIEMKPGKCVDTKGEADKLCTFDDYDCGYKVISRSRTLNWEWKTGNKSVTHLDTKPETDHTLGTEKGGYWFSGSSSTYDLEKSVLSSPTYNTPKQPLNCLHFYYYMDADRGNWDWSKTAKEAYIQVHVNVNSSRKLLVTRAKSVTKQRQWTYVEAKTEISEKYNFEFTFALNTPVQAAIAIDDIKLFPGSCTEAEPTTEPPTIPTEMPQATTHVTRFEPTTSSRYTGYSDTGGPVTSYTEVGSTPTSTPSTPTGDSPAPKYKRMNNFIAEKIFFIGQNVFL